MVRKNSMGKAAKVKKYGKYISSSLNDCAKVSYNNHKENFSLGGEINSGCLNDLESFDASKRSKACSILAEVFSRPQNDKTECKYASSDVLNKLSLRLVDADSQVCMFAAAALRNISSSCSVNVNNQMIKSSIIGNIYV